MRLGAQGWCTGMNLGDGMGREVGGGSGWGTHVHPWLIHVNAWQKPPQYCKVISFQLKFKKKKNLPFDTLSFVKSTNASQFPLSSVWPAKSSTTCTSVYLTCYHVFSLTSSFRTSTLDVNQSKHFLLINICTFFILYIILSV